jgi:uncharacterized damage-inducible protein DinB
VEARLTPLYEIFKLNTRLYLNCLDGMDDDRASWRPTEATNSAAFLALHLIDTRHWLAKSIGAAATNPFEGITRGAKGIDDIEVFPSLDAMRTEWKSVTGAVRARLAALTTADLAQAAPAKLPAVDDPSLLGLLAFAMQHDAYHVGQLALLRKQTGMPAMSYR